MQFTISLRSTGLLYLGTVRPRGSSNRYLRSTSMPNSKTLAEVYVAFPLFSCTEFLYQRHISLMSCRFKHPKDKAQLLAIFQGLCRKARLQNSQKEIQLKSFSELQLTTFSNCAEQTSQDFLCEQWKPGREGREKNETVLKSTCIKSLQ